MNKKLRIQNFIKQELSGWRKCEVIGYILILSLIIYNATIMKDSIVAVISAFCGITYTIIAGKGKISCYLFGLTGSGFYAYLAFSNGIYGNFLLYVLYYIPMQILGVINWSKHLNKKNNEIYKTELDIRGKIGLTLIALILCIITIIILDLFKDAHPYFDGIATALSLVGMYLTVKRCIEQWLIWGIVNLLTATMWLKIIYSGGKVYSTALMWIVYLFLAVYFYKEWLNDLKKEQQ